MDIQYSILRILGQAEKLDNIILPLEIKRLDKLIIAMMISLPPVPSAELKQILWYVASPQIVNASLKRLEDMNYIYSQASTLDTFWTYGTATASLLKDDKKKNTKRPTISSTRLQQYKLKASLLLQQIQSNLKPLYLSAWAELTEVEQESIIKRLYVKEGPFAEFLKADKIERTALIKCFNLPDEEKQTLVDAKSYNSKSLTHFIENVNVNSSDFQSFRANFLALVKKKSNDIVDLLTRGIDVSFDMFQDIFIKGMCGGWRVGKLRRAQFYSDAATPDKHDSRALEQYQTILKKLEKYDINKQTIQTNTYLLQNQTNKEALADIYTIIDKARSENNALCQDIRVINMTQDVVSYNLFLDNGIIPSQLNKDRVTFYFLCNGTDLKNKAFARKLMLCSDFAEFFQRKAHITIMGITENDIKRFEKMYNKVFGREFKPYLPATVTFKVYNPAKVRKTEIIKNLMGGGDNE